MLLRGLGTRMRRTGCTKQTGHPPASFEGGFSSFQPSVKFTSSITMMSTPYKNPRPSMKRAWFVRHSPSRIVSGVRRRDAGL